MVRRARSAGRIGCAGISAAGTVGRKSGGSGSDLTSVAPARPSSPRIPKSRAGRSRSKECEWKWQNRQKQFKKGGLGSAGPMLQPVDVDRRDARAEGTRSSGRRSGLRLIFTIGKGEGN